MSIARTAKTHLGLLHTLRALDLRTLFLIAIVLEGYVVLATELLAIRSLVPYVGNDTPVIAIIISAVLLPLAVGYNNGGQLYSKLMQRSGSLPIRDILIRNALIASVFLTAGLSYLTLEWFFGALAWMHITSRLAQTVLYSLIFLVTPVYLLAQTTPLISNYFNKHQMSQTAGRILFASTVGSFLGAILTSLFLMHTIGVHNTVITTIAALALFIILLSRRYVSTPNIIALAVCMVALNLNNGWLLAGRGIVSDNQYSTVKIENIPDEAQYHSRVMSINNSTSSKYTTNPDKDFLYIQFIQKLFLDKLPKDKVHDILVIGAGGFTLGKDDLTNRYHYIDIDPSLRKVSEEYLLKKPLGQNKQFIAQPARAFLKHDKLRYDVIVLDVYTNTINLPFDMVTKESFEQIKSHLSEKGVMVANIIARHNFSDDWSIKIDNTIRQVFPNLVRIPVQKHAPQEDLDSNIIYAYYHHASAEQDAIYTDDKNGYFWDR